MGHEVGCHGVECHVGWDVNLQVKKIFIFGQFRC